MARLDEIKAEREALHRRRAIEESLLQLQEEEKRIRASGQTIDLSTDDEGETKVKMEHEEGLNTSDHRREAIAHDIHEDDRGRRSGPQEQDLHRADQGNRQTTFNPAHHEMAPPPIGPPQEQSPGPRRQSMGFGSHRIQDSDSPHSTPATQQPYIGGGAGPEGAMPRPPADEIQRWREDVPDHDSAFSSADQYPTAADSPVAAPVNIAPEPAPHHQRGLLSSSRSMFGSGSGYGQPQLQQADQVPGYQALQQPVLASRYQRDFLHPSQRMFGPAYPNQLAQTDRAPGDRAFQQASAPRRGMLGDPIGVVGLMPHLAQIKASAARRVENHKYGKHPTFPTLVEKPDRNGYWELACHMCGGNVIRNTLKVQNGKVLGGQFFQGVAGIRSHINSCHPAELDEAGKISTRTIVEKCAVRELTDVEVKAMTHKHKGAYKIEMKAGASADANSAVRREHP